ncbi:uncharacterized protein N7469_004712 [Penicillium citrinum]|uniref:Uncharacterized protein n=2 Tax=Penicillium TaxID=5073 RepID=A0A9W9P534_PENCI|nr:uncharacterized protein N7469_004712 [Penicillium citrinum]KAJ5235544.1 hypothetical protein N7469_004712 [Penicillium citrinum]KAJ5591107.1 hypothetical protein N7450_005079 [Penicillium hetheringtonii]KAK5800093.1 hypothetical protein VI817_002305 [Penicillium citrinum]
MPRIGVFSGTEGQDEGMQAWTSALDAVMAWEAALSPPSPAHMFDDLLVQSHVEGRQGSAGRRQRNS